MKDGQRPLYVNSIAVGKDGSVYTLCRITADGHTRTDLIRIPSESIVLAQSPRATGLTNPLAIRIMNYGKYQDDAWTHLPSLGMHYVFLSAPKADQVAALEKRLADHHLRPLVLRGDTDLGRASSVDELAAQLAVCETMGVKYLFLSPKHTGVSKEVACERLRRAGDVGPTARSRPSCWKPIPTWGPTPTPTGRPCGGSITQMSASISTPATLPSTTRGPTR